ncbi:uncharacterized protein LOC103523953 [Trichonephila clavipes]|nr:uncharacterized protein LOC103523953 [Trichonephila clavipes]
MPIKSITEERALLLWEKITRIPECLSHSKERERDSLSYTNKNLKSQKGFLQKTMALKGFHGFNLIEPEDLTKSSNSTERYEFALSTELLQEVQKKETGSQILRILSLETFDTLYLEDEWLYVYKDGSKLTDNSNAGAGVCCNLLSFYTPIGIHSTAYDAEISAIRIALSQLLCHTDRVSKVVILCDSRGPSKRYLPPRHLYQWIFSNVIC